MRADRTTTPSVGPTSWAECLIDLGRRVRRQMRSGVGIEELPNRLNSTVELCLLAFVLVESHDRLKLRAMVEDWSIDRIVAEIADRAVQAAW